MRAVVFDRTAAEPRLRLVDVPDPVPAQDELLVRVEHVGVNHMELLQIAGQAPPGALARVTPGIDPVGIVVAHGDGVIDGPAVGTRVVVKPGLVCGACTSCTHGNDDACRALQIVGVHRNGGWADLVTVPARNAFVVPAPVEPREASAFSHSFPVAEQVFRRCAPVLPDEVVLVIGGAGGVGSAAVQLAVHRGCRVLATASTPAKADVVRRLGATAVPTGPDDEPFAATVRALAPDGVDVVIDTAADPALWRDLPGLLGPLARVGVCGTHGGGLVDLDLRWLYRSRARLAGSAGASVAAYTDAHELLGARAIRPLVASSHPLEAFEDALAALRTRDRAGKVLLDVNPSPHPDPA